MNKSAVDYMGFEIGPIRPPSEQTSLLLRVTRNCPWNKCKFCGLYKGQSFSVRKKEDVIRDLEMIRYSIDALEEMEECSDLEKGVIQNTLFEKLGRNNKRVYQIASNWYRAGMTSVFLQDGNTMVVKPDDMVEILLTLRSLFPTIQRITSYGRAHTIARISDCDLLRLSKAGLNRIHIGMETGSDEILKSVNKGVDKSTQIIAGQKVRATGIELSEYFMPGLGGREFSNSNALETADAINQINPNFIRIRTLAVTKKSELYKDYESGIFTRTNDVDMMKELYLFIESLNGISSMIKSDHILNLMTELEGKLPEDKEKMLSVISWFLELSEEDKMLFRIGRRGGMLKGIQDFDMASKKRIAEICVANKIDYRNVDQIVDEMMNRFI